MPNTQSTRRRFLQATAGLAAATPYFWTSRRLRAEPANDKFNIAAIGVGGRGAGIGHQAGNLGNMVACADVHLGNANRFAERYEGKCEVHQDYRKLLDRKDIDAITCGTPDHWHTKIAIDAMRAGKDVYCEKPLTLTMQEGAQIMQVTRETGRVFQVGTQQRSENNHVFLKAVAIARSGRLGTKLHALSSVGGATSGGPFPTEEPPADLDWELWLGQAPMVPFSPNRIGWNFRWWLEYSGGQVTDWGVHHTDIAVWALGGEQTGVVHAAPVEGECSFPLGRELMRDTLLGRKPFEELPVSYNVANRFRVDMKLENENEITLFSGSNELIISGEKGRIRVNRGGLTGAPVEEIEADAQQREWLDQQVRTLYRNMPLSGHMGNFFHCMKTREKPISDVWSDCHSVNACHMANIAMLLDRPVRFDPKAYQFIDDQQANEMMSRKQREPYGT
jgi:myo-inositol 2-dehydrogenase / D-chiro-inositol 1-dehydrogenase